MERKGVGEWGSRTNLMVISTTRYSDIRLLEIRPMAEVQNSYVSLVVSDIRKPALRFIEMART